MKPIHKTIIITAVFSVAVLAPLLFVFTKEKPAKKHKQAEQVDDGEGKASERWTVF
jgi:hypothetical protein